MFSYSKQIIKNYYGFLKYHDYKAKTIIINLRINNKFQRRNIGSYFLYNFNYLHEFSNKPIFLYAWEEIDNPYKLNHFYEKNSFITIHKDIHTDQFHTIYTMYKYPTHYFKYIKLIT